MEEESSKYTRALTAIDGAHAEDPRKIGETDSIPYELHYARKMTGYLERLSPEASAELRLAVRAQHLRRWEVARDSYPMNRQGYHAWRTALKKRQAQMATELCRGSGYAQAEADRVGALIRKENLKTDVECQILEDVACLVFLDDQFDAFEKEHDEGKIVSILRKTWAKMSERGHEVALQMVMSDRARGLIEKALSSASSSS
ncbi:MAG: hypothetical protein M1816_001908 [Peltula sp. TS41687]|nr:MAG: hypothetical protein M1816_001908 [Peltula sp. TS41687]